MTFIVHTQRGEAGIHFFYQVNAHREDAAFEMLKKQGAIDCDETHVETLPVIEGERSHDLIAIIKTR